MKSGISLCMIVRDEERFLAGALQSVEGAVDEICVVDTGSTDATVAIAERHGARIAHVPWTNDFSAARNAALAMATHAWILVLDADEALAPESRDAVRAVAKQRPNGRGRWIRCHNIIDGKRNVAASTHAIIRIFPNDPTIRYRGRLHEYVARVGDEHSLEADRTPIEILHYGYQEGIIAERKKGERNLDLSRAEVEAVPDDPARRYNYAMSAALAGQTALAREQLEHVIAQTEGTPRGFRPLALAHLSGYYLDEGRPDEALAAADRCIAIVPTFTNAHYARGKALAALSRFHDARDAFGAAIAAKEKNHEHFVVDEDLGTWKAHNEIAGTLVREGRHAEARRWLELALANRPGERLLLLNRARACEHMGDLREAVAAFRAMADGFRDEAAATEYVNFVFRHGSPEAGLTAVEDMLPFAGPETARMFLASAAAFFLRAGRRREARDLLARVLEVDGDPAAAEPMVAALASHFQTPELSDLLALAAATPAAPGGSS